MVATSKELKVLLVEDSQDDAFLVCRKLEQGGFAVRHERVETEKSLAAALEQGEWDIIISDYTLPSFNGIDAYSILQASGKDIPFIIVSGTIGEETAVEAMRLGVNDYLLKENLARLAPSVQRALADAEERRGRRQAEDALDANRQLLETIFEAVPIPIFVKDAECRYILGNPALSNLHDLPIEQILGVTSEQIPTIANEEGAKLLEQDRRVLEAGEDVYSPDFNLTDGRGRKVVCSIRKTPLRDGTGHIVGIVGVSEDITERKNLEQQLLHSQKLEVVGQLAGGVAHEFNNLLQIIISYTLLALNEPHQSSKNPAYLNHVLKAGQQAGDLTRQLLAFSRKTELQRQSFDLRDLVSKQMNFIGRVLGENIEQIVISPDDPAWIEADPGLLEQVIMNLCINARDAMPDGGQLRIEITSLFADASYCQIHRWETPGRYVCLQITDSGTGMSQQVQERIFEPFYTTKELGKGTGLGLAMVFGIVQQHGGIIDVYSEPELGTTFKIYLPSSEAGSEDRQLPTLVDPPGGTESILVAEDDENIRELLRDLLEGKGYKVTLASDGNDAMIHFERNSSDIDLVLSDFVMPKISGNKLFQRIREICPEIPFVFSTGYAPALADKDFLDANNLQMVQKPYVPTELFGVVRDALDGAGKRPGVQFAHRPRAIRKW